MSRNAVDYAFNKALKEIIGTNLRVTITAGANGHQQTSTFEIQNYKMLPTVAVKELIYDRTEELRLHTKCVREVIRATAQQRKRERSDLEAALPYQPEQVLQVLRVRERSVPQDVVSVESSSLSALLSLQDRPTQARIEELDTDTDNESTYSVKTQPRRFRLTQQASPQPQQASPQPQQASPQPQQASPQPQQPSSQPQAVPQPQTYPVNIKNETVTIQIQQSQWAVVQQMREEDLLRLQENIEGEYDRLSVAYKQKPSDNIRANKYMERLNSYANAAIDEFAKLYIR